MKGTAYDALYVLLFGFVSSAGLVCCVKLWLGGLSDSWAQWLFADGFFFALVGVVGYSVCMVRFVNYLRER